MPDGCAMGGVEENTGKQGSGGRRRRDAGGHCEDGRRPIRRGMSGASGKEKLPPPAGTPPLYPKERWTPASARHPDGERPGCANDCKAHPGTDL